jgi:hypothetical protein
MSGTIKTQKNTMTVSNGTAVSNGIETKNRTASGLITPAVLTNATILFESSVDGTTWVPLMIQDGASQYSVTCSTSEARLIPLNVQVTQTAEWIRLKFGSNELGNRTFTLLTRIVD